MKRTLHLLLLAAAVCASARSLTAAPAPKNPVFVAFFDQRVSPATGVVAERERVALFPFSRISTHEIDCATAEAESVKIGQLWNLVGCATQEEEEQPSAPKKLLERSAATERLSKAIVRLAAEGSMRAISEKGNTLIVVVIQTGSLHTLEIRKDKKDNEPIRTIPLFVDGMQPRIGVKEDKRQQQIEADVQTLMKVALAVRNQAQALAQGASQPPPPQECMEDLPNLDKCFPGHDFTEGVSSAPWLTLHPYSFKLTRATLSLDVKLSDKDAVLATIKEDYRKTAQAKIGQSVEDKLLAELRNCPPTGNKKYASLNLLTCRTTSTNSPSDRAAAATAIGELGNPKGILVLQTLLSDDNSNVRGSATAAIGKLKAGSNPAASKDDAENTDKPSDSRASILSGPAEHWFLSADVLLTAKSITSSGDDGISIEKPPVFYVGFDFLLGDLSSESRPLWGNLVLKGMIKGARKPLDSYGFGLGLRGHYLKRLGIDFDTISPFGAVTWSRANADSGRARDRGLRWGISVNLDKALGWLKPSE